jgi:hypothetical protein
MVFEPVQHPVWPSAHSPCARLERTTFEMRSLWRRGIAPAQRPLRINLCKLAWLYLPALPCWRAAIRDASSSR